MWQTHQQDSESKWPEYVIQIREVPSESYYNIRNNRWALKGYIKQWGQSRFMNTNILNMADWIRQPKHRLFKETDKQIKASL